LVLLTPPPPIDEWILPLPSEISRFNDEEEFGGRGGNREVNVGLGVENGDAPLDIDRSDAVILVVSLLLSPVDIILPDGNRGPVILREVVVNYY